MVSRIQSKIVRRLLLKVISRKLSRFIATGAHCILIILIIEILGFFDCISSVPCRPKVEEDVLWFRNKKHRPSDYFHNRFFLNLFQKKISRIPFDVFKPRRNGSRSVPSSMQIDAARRRIREGGGFPKAKATKSEKKETLVGVVETKEVHVEPMPRWPVMIRRRKDLPKKIENKKRTCRFRTNRKKKKQQPSRPRSRSSRHLSGRSVAFHNPKSKRCVQTFLAPRLSLN